MLRRYGHCPSASSDADSGTHGGGGGVGRISHADCFTNRAVAYRYGFTCCERALPVTCVCIETTNFDTDAYFGARGVAGFYPYAEVVFRVTDPASHHHVPLLLSPFGFSTYRGS